MKKGFPDFSENPHGGVRGIRTLEPLKTTNTLAGCPYRPLRHDSTVLSIAIDATACNYTIYMKTKHHILEKSLNMRGFFLESGGIRVNVYIGLLSLEKVTATAAMTRAIPMHSPKLGSSPNAIAISVAMAGLMDCITL